MDDGCAVRSFDLDYHRCRVDAVGVRTVLLRHVGADLPFEPGRTFVGLPAGTICESTIDLRTGLMLIDLTVSRRAS